MHVRLAWCGEVFRHLFISLCVFLLLPSLLQGACCLPQSRSNWTFLPVRRNLCDPGTLQTQAEPRTVADPCFYCSEQP